MIDGQFSSIKSKIGAVIRLGITAPIDLYEKN